MGSNVVKARFSRAPYLLGCLSFYSGQDKLKNRWEWSQLRSIILPLHTWAWGGTIPHHRGGKVYFDTPSNFGRPHFENRPSTFLKKIAHRPHRRRKIFVPLFQNFEFYVILEVLTVFSTSITKNSPRIPQAKKLV